MDGSDVAAARESRFRGKGSGLGAARGPARKSWARTALGLLSLGEAVAFLGASVIHFGLSIPLGFTTLADATILPAGIAEGVIGLAFAIAAAATFARWNWAWNGTLAAYLLGIIGVLIGLSVSAVDSGDSSRTNFLFHLTILPVLVVGMGLLVTRGGRTGLGTPSAAPKVSP